MSARRMIAGTSESGTNRVSNRTRTRGGGGEPMELRQVRAQRAADDPELRALDRGERPQEHVDALVRADHPEAQDHGPLRALELIRERAFLGQAREVVERAVRDHVDPGGVHAGLAESLGPV